MPKKHTHKLKKLQIEDVGIHLLARVKVNGVMANMVVDTGASRTVFDLEKMKTFNLDIEKTDYLSSGIGTNSLESVITVIENFQIGRLKIKDFPVVLIDLQHVNTSYEMLKLPPVIGIIGGDLLNTYNANINYNTSKIIFTINVEQ
jgi:predicted aspartyl protease